MTARLDMAAPKGCDAVEPDNVDPPSSMTIAPARVVIDDLAVGL